MRLVRKVAMKRKSLALACMVAALILLSACTKPQPQVEPTWENAVWDVSSWK